jgi:hypothetical protein
MDAAGTTNSTNLFELPVNNFQTSSEPHSTWLSLGTIAAIGGGCVAAFFLGAAAAVLTMLLWQRRKTAGAGFEHVDKRISFDGATDSKAGKKEITREVDC